MSRGFCFACTGFVLTALAVTTSFAFADTQISASIQGASGSSVSVTGNSVSLTLPAENSGATPPILDPGAVLDFGKYQYVQGNTLHIDVTAATKTFKNMTAGGTPVLVVTTDEAAPGQVEVNAVPVPASAPGSCPSESGCFDHVLVASPARGNTQSQSKDYFRAFTIQPGQKIGLDIDPVTLCDSTGGEGLGCESSLLGSEGGPSPLGMPTEIRLTVGVYIVPPGVPLNSVPLWTSYLAQGDKPATLKLIFKSSSSSNQNPAISDSSDKQTSSESSVAAGSTKLPRAEALK